ncbi:MAG: PQQ-dependent sugar dehydrogenase [Polyangiaceae bacterium]|jgi:glucose/arabinose dehydrogenase/cytochrome c2
MRASNALLSFGPLLVAAIASISVPARPGGTTGAESTESPGQRIFVQRCALCHATDDRGSQGPGLGGVVGRPAASTHFGYTRALRDSGLVWDRSTLDRFLAAPSQVVPGTAMPMPVPDPDERRQIVDYLATLVSSVPSSGRATSMVSALPAPALPAPRSGRDALGDYRSDGPGVRRRFTVGDLPAPFATPSSRNAPEVVSPPAGAHPYVPPGFRADVFAADLDGPRVLRVAPSGDVFVAESQAGRIRVLRARDGVSAVEENRVFASGLDQPFGIAFYPPGGHPEWVYIAENNAIVRFPYRDGDTSASGAPETIVPRLIGGTGGHWTRDIAFSTDGATMFVSVGSGSNVAEDGEDETDRADVLAFDPIGRNRHVFASGIRNCSGLAVHPTTGDVWCATNERDGLGDDLVPDYVTRVRAGAFYGWPWYYLGDHQDPRHDGERPDLLGHVTVPDVLLQAHSAALQVAFYRATAFPPEYRGAFVTLHGSWNRSKRTGPKVVLLPLTEDAPTGEYVDFMTGFVVDDETVWARPVGVAVAHDGALFVGEDGNGTIWRITPTGGARAGQ